MPGWALVTQSHRHADKTSQLFLSAGGGSKAETFATGLVLSTASRIFPLPNLHLGVLSELNGCVDLQRIPPLKSS